MHQFETIIAAVELAIQHSVNNAIPAILKEYIMDEHYVAKQDRHDLLVLINNKLDTKYSLTGIKKGNPVILKTLPFELPEKAVLVRTDKVIGSTEIPADSALISHTHTANTAQQGTTEMQTNAQQSQAQESNQSSNTELRNTLVQDNTKPGNPSKKDKAKKDKRVEVATEEADLAKAESKRFAKAFVDAHAKGKVKKADRHVKLAFGMDSIDQFGINVIYAFMRPTIKFMVNAIKELPGMKDAGQRATVFESWVNGDEDRAKAFKRFNKRASKVLDKPDHIMAMFLLLSEENLRVSIEFANFAYTEAEAVETGDDTYAFVRENSNGVNPRWTAAAGAVIGGTVDMAMNGFDVSAIAGAAIATGSAFYAGGLLEDSIENPHLRDFAAGALGGIMGVGGARIGRNIGRALSDDDETMVEQSDSTVVATIPAQVITQRTEPVHESGGMLTGLAALMAG